MHYSPPGSFAHGILQARILEQVAFPPREDLSSSGIKTHISCVFRVGRQILYHWAIWEVWSEKNTLLTLLVQSRSDVWLFVTPWTAARQASLSFTISWSLLKLMSIQSVMPSNLLSAAPFSSCLPSFPATKSFSYRHIKCKYDFNAKMAHVGLLTASLI